MEDAVEDSDNAMNLSTLRHPKASCQQDDEGIAERPVGQVVDRAGKEPASSRRPLLLPEFPFPSLLAEGFGVRGAVATFHLLVARRTRIIWWPLSREDR
jgi:hypothetical protein